MISSVHEENGDEVQGLQSVIFHVCAEKSPGESDSDILEAMEEGGRWEVVRCCGGVLYLDAVGWMSCRSNPTQPFFLVFREPSKAKVPFKDIWVGTF